MQKRARKNERAKKKTCKNKCLVHKSARKKLHARTHACMHAPHRTAPARDAFVRGVEGREEHDQVVGPGLCFPVLGEVSIRQRYDGVQRGQVVQLLRHGGGGGRLLFVYLLLGVVLLSELHLNQFFFNNIYTRPRRP